MTRPLLPDMARFGKLATRSQLRELGHSDRGIQKAVALGQLYPLRRSWLASPGANTSAMRAVTLGGRLAATSVLASHGVWVTRQTGLWVASPPHSSRLARTRPGERRLWVSERFPNADGKRWRVSVSDALLQYIGIGEDSDVIASIDSALRKGLITTARLHGIFAAAPRRTRRMLKKVNGKSGSGLETIIRLACLAEGWRVDAQVYVDGVGHVDLLIDGWLVIELDGAEWHDGPAAQDEDGRRDAEVTLLGFRYHRFRYTQVMNQLPLCLAVIRTILASGQPVLPS